MAKKRTPQLVTAQRGKHYAGPFRALAPANAPKTPRGSRRARATFTQRSRAIAPSEKAAYHDVVGAGKSRIKREFMGLTAADEDAIVDRIDGGLTQALKEA